MGWRALAPEPPLVPVEPAVHLLPLVETPRGHLGGYPGGPEGSRPDLAGVSDPPHAGRGDEEDSLALFKNRRLNLLLAGALLANCCHTRHLESDLRRKDGRGNR